MSAVTLAPVQRDGDQLFTTSEAIAQGAGVEHRATLQLIDRHLADLEEFGQVAFEMRAGYNNAQVRTARLNEPQSTLLLTYLRNTEQVRAFKKALVKAFYEMARQLNEARPAELTRSDLARMVLEAEEERKALAAKVEADAPKVGYVDKFVASADTMTFRTVASTLEVGETQLRELLIAAGWIYRETSERWSDKAGKKVPQHRYSEMAHKKAYFLRREVHDAPRFRGEVDHTLKITPSGAFAIDALIRRSIATHGDLPTAIATLDAQRRARAAERAAA